MILDIEKAVKDSLEQAMKECELTIGMTLKEAVEKQIPKMVEGNDYVVRYCPNCNAVLDDYYNFCSCCGQALDWSEN